MRVVKLGHGQVQVPAGSTWLIFTQINSSTRVYPHTRMHSRPTSMARPVTQRKSKPSS